MCCFNEEYIGLDGNPITRTPEKYPYSYDTFFVFKSDNYDNVKSEMVYSDRMLNSDYEKFTAATQKVWSNAGQQFYNKKPEDINKFLNLYFGKEVKLTAILEGCNFHNGFPYWIFAFTE